ncbi:RNA polymerase subunit sigma-70 [Streptomyces phaeoluteigriseus]|uniref:RNA polymerase subunit sigma-70 n=1 Tax=Streptomyces phaeoluteigriseus TaxID=114686 RepID=A0ABY4Z2Z0_9ACTN|nr:sigma factor-like helix-turn-helix DNA-binding protein [Streptomyces phaeoluteigriseus]USQ83192.1 RNA polymerase subunit sigma-70 [Streptomyces phaeoluteigriseus]
MRARHAAQDVRRAKEFEAFVAGAGGRLTQTATLLTGEAPDGNPRARRLLTFALAHTYACWDRLHGEDPYDHARRHLAIRFADTAWHQYATWQHYAARDRARRRPAGPLAGLTPRERLILVLSLYEGVGEEQVAALLGLPTERVHAICDRATATVLHPPPAPSPPLPGAKAATT